MNRIHAKVVLGLDIWVDKITCVVRNMQNQGKRTNRHAQTKTKAQKGKHKWQELNPGTIQQHSCDTFCTTHAKRTNSAVLNCFLFPSERESGNNRAEQVFLTEYLSQCVCWVTNNTLFPTLRRVVGYHHLTTPSTICQHFWWLLQHYLKNTITLGEVVH